MINKESLKAPPAAARILSRGNGIKPDRFINERPSMVIAYNNRVTENCNKE